MLAWKAPQRTIALEGSLLDFQYMSNGFFYANKAKTKRATLKHLKNEIHACKTRLDNKNPRSGQHPERDRNEMHICATAPSEPIAKDTVNSAL